MEHWTWYPVTFPLIHTFKNATKAFFFSVSWANKDPNDSPVGGEWDWCACDFSCINGASLAGYNLEICFELWKRSEKSSATNQNNSCFVFSFFIGYSFIIFRMCSQGVWTNESAHNVTSCPSNVTSLRRCNKRESPWPHWGGKKTTKKAITPSANTLLLCRVPCNPIESYSQQPKYLNT